ncbi:hypothetical protein Aazo_4007 ['Nostoc azollae' 0708]|jgi:hypothetical protein|uniref:Uncharacterized protein n=1 Tax=Nostoc azollae (strain 0708) TaxID=551115 RepID=D7E5C6_NOSA0|nr:hypothetical protein Aazo_4007 ['Nostoc azollae' 0708]
MLIMYTLNTWGEEVIQASMSNQKDREQIFRQKYSPNSEYSQP